MIGVNRKALDQYLNFSQQRQQFYERCSNLSDEKSKIQELMDGLDYQKEEAIWRTFQGVSKHFSDVFQELVPTGKGSLSMVRSSETGAEHDMEALSLISKEEKVSSRPYRGPSIDEFHGVQVKVAFSQSGQQFEMHQLSGGQKALVALALIFAIQRSTDSIFVFIIRRCDPAPFYLFDEIDQALDTTYRIGVARLIQKQSTDVDNPTQFITTTFRPELVTVGNKCYGIALENKNSKIYPLSKVYLNYQQPINLSLEGRSSICTKSHGRR